MSNDFRASNAGGFSFSLPAYSFGNTVPAVNSGLSFDLPMSVIEGFSNNALSFANNNSDRAQNFVTNMAGLGMSNVQQTQDRAAPILNDGWHFLNMTGYMMEKTIDKAGARNARKGGGGCFITTAICKRDGKPDNCDELQTLRHFRDTAMAENVEWSALVREYYEIAPAIVARIDALPNRESIYAILRDQYLYPAIAAVKAGRNAEAISLYREMVDVADVFSQGE